VLRRWVFPACAQLKLPNATWLTLIRVSATTIPRTPDRSDHDDIREVLKVLVSGAL